MYYVYRITCLINNKVYIGQTKNYKDRIQHHKYHLKINNHDNKYLQEDYNKYKLDNFIFEIISEHETREQALDKETYYIEKAGGKESPNVYNMQDKNGFNSEFIDILSGSNNHMFGKKMSLESREKMSKAKQGLYNGKNHPNYGKHLSQETKDKISRSEKGKIISKEQRIKISRSLKAHYENLKNR